MIVIIWHVSKYFFFFFSSRRRHTRCSRDWSSDVCSSDLGAVRRKRSQVASRNRQHLGHSPLRGHQKKPREACRRGARAVRTEENVLAVGGSEERRVGESVDLGGRRII